jgi:site-specific recombinase XerD
MTDNELVIKQSNDALALTKENKEFIYCSVAASTQKVYRSDFNIFRVWCESLNHQWMPAFPQVISQFLTEQAISGIKPSTLSRRLAAIKMACKAWECPDPTEHHIVKSTIKGIKRAKGTRVNKKSPVTAERLATMFENIPSNLIGLRDRALLLLGFAGAFRRSELVALTLNDIERTPEGIKVLIRKSKGDQEGKGQVVPILNGTRFRVADTLYSWLKEAHITEGFLFRRIRRGSNVQKNGLTPHAVAEIVKRYAILAGLNPDSFSGHSLRAGFITSGANAGADLFKLMEISRHKKPETIIGYVRESKLFDNHAGEKFL